MSENGSKRCDPDSSSHKYINFIPEYVLQFINIEINVLKFTNENNLSAYIIEDVMKSFHFQKIDGVYKQNWYCSFLWIILIKVEIDYTFD